METNGQVIEEVLENLVSTIETIEESKEQNVIENVLEDTFGATKQYESCKEKMDQVVVIVPKPQQTVDTSSSISSDDNFASSSSEIEQESSEDMAAHSLIELSMHQQLKSPDVKDNNMLNSVSSSQKNVKCYSPEELAKLSSIFNAGEKPNTSANNNTEKESLKHETAGTKVEELSKFSPLEKVDDQDVATTSIEQNLGKEPIKPNNVESQKKVKLFPIERVGGQTAPITLLNPRKEPSSPVNGKSKVEEPVKLQEVDKQNSPNTSINQNLGKDSLTTVSKVEGLAMPSVQKVDKQTELATSINEKLEKFGKNDSKEEESIKLPLTGRVDEQTPSETVINQIPGKEPPKPITVELKEGGLAALSSTQIVNKRTEPTTSINQIPEEQSMSNTGESQVKDPVKLSLIEKANKVTPPDISIHQNQQKGISKSETEKVDRKFIASTSVFKNPVKESPKPENPETKFNEPVKLFSSMEKVNETTPASTSMNQPATNENDLQRIALETITKNAGLQTSFSDILQQEMRKLLPSLLKEVVQQNAVVTEESNVKQLPSSAIAGVDRNQNRRKGVPKKIVTVMKNPESNLVTDNHSATDDGTFHHLKLNSPPLPTKPLPSKAVVDRKNPMGWDMNGTSSPTSPPSNMNYHHGHAARGYPLFTTENQPPLYRTVALIPGPNPWNTMPQKIISTISKDTPNTMNSNPRSMFSANEATGNPHIIPTAQAHQIHISQMMNEGYLATGNPHIIPTAQAHQIHISQIMNEGYLATQASTGKSYIIPPAQAHQISQLMDPTGGEQTFSDSAELPANLRWNPIMNKFVPILPQMDPHRKVRSEPKKKPPDQVVKDIMVGTDVYKRKKFMEENYANKSAKKNSKQPTKQKPTKTTKTNKTFFKNANMLSAKDADSICDTFKSSDGTVYYKVRWNVCTWVKREDMISFELNELVKKFEQGQDGINNNPSNFANAKNSVSTQTVTGHSGVNYYLLKIAAERKLALGQQIIEMFRRKDLVDAELDKICERYLKISSPEITNDSFFQFTKESLDNYNRKHDNSQQKNNHAKQCELFSPSKVVSATVPTNTIPLDKQSASGKSTMNTDDVSTPLQSHSKNINVHFDINVSPDSNEYGDETMSVGSDVLEIDWQESDFEEPKSEQNGTVERKKCPTIDENKPQMKSPKSSIDEKRPKTEQACVSGLKSPVLSSNGATIFKTETVVTCETKSPKHSIGEKRPKISETADEHAPIAKQTCKTLHSAESMPVQSNENEDLFNCPQLDANLKIKPIVMLSANKLTEQKKDGVKEFDFVSTLAKAKVPSKVAQQQGKEERCKHCQQTLYGSINIRSHFAKYSRYKCPRCGIQICNGKKLYKHMKTHLRYRYQCHKCLKQFEQFSLYKEHKKSTHYVQTLARKAPQGDSASTKKCVWECIECKKRFKTFMAVRKHRVKFCNRIPSETLLACTNCRRMFKTAESLARHRQLHKDFCPTLKPKGKRRMRKFSLGKTRTSVRRINIKHKMTFKNNYCILCIRGFRDIDSFYAHLNKSKCPYFKEDGLCMLCKKMFHSLDALKSHIKTCFKDTLISLAKPAGKRDSCSSGSDTDSSRNTRAVFHCSRCRTMFPSKLIFQKHNSMFHGKLRTLQCNKCFFKCKSANRLKMHLKKKQCPKMSEYRCFQCSPKKESTTFKSLHAFMEHTRSHFKEAASKSEPSRILPQEIKILPQEIRRKDGKISLLTLCKKDVYLLKGRHCICEIFGCGKYKIAVKPVENDFQVVAVPVDKEKRLRCFSCNKSNFSNILEHFRCRHKFRFVRPTICGLCNIVFKDHLSFVNHRDVAHIVVAAAGSDVKTTTTSLVPPADTRGNVNTTATNDRSSTKILTTSTPQKAKTKPINCIPQIPISTGMRTNSSDSRDVFICERCESGIYQTKDELIAHLSAKHFMNADQIAKSGYTVAKTVEWSCCVCLKGINELFQHAVMHTRFILECYRCNVKVSSKPALVRHFNQKHLGHVWGEDDGDWVKQIEMESINWTAQFLYMNRDSELPKAAPTFDPKHRCNACQELFLHVKSLEQHHLKRACAKEKYKPDMFFQCPICKCVLFERKKMDIHVDVCHNFGADDFGFEPGVVVAKQSELFNCSGCGLQYADKSYMWECKLFHLGTAVETCEVCLDTFSNPQSLMYHMHSAHQLHFCTMCRKGFHNYDELRNHCQLHVIEHGVKRDYNGKMVIELDETPGKRYKEKLFPKESMDQEKFVLTSKIPVDVLNDSRLFYCPVCRKNIEGELTFIVHIKTHDWSRRLRCLFCNESFVSKEDLQEHYQKQDHSLNVHLTDKNTHMLATPEGFACYHCCLVFNESKELEQHTKKHKNKTQNGELQKGHDVIQTVSRYVEYTDNETNKKAPDWEYARNSVGIESIINDRTKVMMQHISPHDWGIVTASKSTACSICCAPNRSNDEHHLESHFAKATPRTVKCCRTTFVTSEELSKHVLQSHSKNKQLWCPYCHIFCNAQHIVTHYKNLVSTSSKIRCTFCNLVFNKKCFKQHLMVHPNQKHDNRSIFLNDKSMTVGETSSVVKSLRSLPSTAVKCLPSSTTSTSVDSSVSSVSASTSAGGSSSKVAKKDGGKQKKSSTSALFVEDNGVSVNNSGQLKKKKKKTGSESSTNNSKKVSIDGKSGRVKKASMKVRMNQKVSKKLAKKLANGAAAKELKPPTIATEDCFGDTRIDEVKDASKTVPPKIQDRKIGKSAKSKAKLLSVGKDENQNLTSDSPVEAPTPTQTKDSKEQDDKPKSVKPRKLSTHFEEPPINGDSPVEESPIDESQVKPAVSKIQSDCKEKPPASAVYETVLENNSESGICEYCTWDFNCYDELKDHLVHHTLTLKDGTEDEVVKLTCHLCSKDLAKNKLSKHMALSHMKETNAHRRQRKCENETSIRISYSQAVNALVANRFFCVLCWDEFLKLDKYLEHFKSDHTFIYKHEVLKFEISCNPEIKAELKEYTDKHSNRQKIKKSASTTVTKAKKKLVSIAPDLQISSESKTITNPKKKLATDASNTQISTESKASTKTKKKSTSDVSNTQISTESKANIKPKKKSTFDAYDPQTPNENKATTKSKNISTPTASDESKTITKSKKKSSPTASVSSSQVSTETPQTNPDDKQERNTPSPTISKRTGTYTMGIPSPSMPYPFNCPVCGRGFYQKGGMMKHVSCLHPNVKIINNPKDTKKIVASQDESLKTQTVMEKVNGKVDSEPLVVLEKSSPNVDIIKNPKDTKKIVATQDESLKTQTEMDEVNKKLDSEPLVVIDKSSDNVDSKQQAVKEESIRTKDFKPSTEKKDISVHESNNDVKKNAEESDQTQLSVFSASEKKSNEEENGPFAPSFWSPTKSSIKFPPMKSPTASLPPVLPPVLSPVLDDETVKNKIESILASKKKTTSSTSSTTRKIIRPGKPPIAFEKDQRKEKSKTLDDRLQMDGESNDQCEDVRSSDGDDERPGHIHEEIVEFEPEGNKTSKAGKPDKQTNLSSDSNMTDIKSTNENDTGKPKVSKANVTKPDTQIKNDVKSKNSASSENGVKNLKNGVKSKNSASSENGVKNLKDNLTRGKKNAVNESGGESESGDNESEIEEETEEEIIESSSEDDEDTKKRNSTKAPSKVGSAPEVSTKKNNEKASKKDAEVTNKRESSTIVLPEKPSVSLVGETNNNNPKTVLEPSETSKGGYFSTNYPLVCLFCGIGFYKRHSLKSHLVKKHANCYTPELEKSNSFVNLNYLDVGTRVNLPVNEPPRKRNRSSKFEEVMKALKPGTKSPVKKSIVLTIKTGMTPTGSKREQGKTLVGKEKKTKKSNEVRQDDRKDKVSNDEEDETDSEGESSDADYKYKCKWCDHLFAEKKFLGKHIARHFKGAKLNKLTCDSCFCLVDRHLLKRHMHLSHAEIKLCQKRNWCLQCNFSSKKSLTKHTMEAHPKLLKIECRICDARFSTTSSYNEHFQMTHGKSLDEESMMCLFCNKKFGSVDKLYCHFSIIHMKKSKSLFCALCRKYFYGRSDLESHHEEFHQNDKFQCGVCLVNFESVQACETHVLVHKTKTVHQCPLCRFYFEDETKLKSHTNTHDEMLKCQACSRIFKSNIEFLSHREDGCKATTTFNATCLHCDAILDSEEGIVEHASAHISKGDDEENSTFDKKELNSKAADKPYMTPTSSLIKPTTGYETDGESMNLLSNDNKCHVCGETFIRYEIYQEHLKKH